MGVTNFSPLAMGMLSGKYDNGLPENSRFSRETRLKDRWFREDIINIVKEFKKFADKLGVTRSQLAIAWLLHRKTLSSVITGANNLDQLKENLKAKDVIIPAEMMEEISVLFGK